MTWNDELLSMLGEAKGDLGIYLALVALRRSENGAPGREFGVLSIPAPTYAQQCHVAGNSLRNSELRQRTYHVNTRDGSGLLTDEYFDGFAQYWAPVKGATNDPTGLNKNLSDNLKQLYHRLSSPVIVCLLNLPQGTVSQPA